MQQHTHSSTGTWHGIFGFILSGVRTISASIQGLLSRKNVQGWDRFLYKISSPPVILSMEKQMLPR